MMTTPAARLQSLAPDPHRLRGMRVCLFLDVDGTLLEFAPTPDGACADDPMRELLARLCVSLGGAVALVSGRTLDQLDALFRPLHLPAAGIHGFERRSATGVVYRPSGEAAALDRIRHWLRTTALPETGLILEDKGHSLALHYRLAPHAASQALAAIHHAQQELGSGYEILHGARVVELKPAGPSKATAIEAFMKEPPFAGCVPVFLGDDATDLDGFAAVRSHAGFDVAVGDRTSARWHLPDPGAVRAWLRTLADTPSRCDA